MEEGDFFDLDGYIDPETKDVLLNVSSKSPREGLIPVAPDEESDDEEDEHSVVESEHGASSSTTSALNQKALHAKNSAKKSGKTPRYVGSDPARRSATPCKNDIRLIHYHLMKMSDIHASIEEMKEKELIHPEYHIRGKKGDNFKRKLRYIIEALAQHPKLGFIDMTEKELTQYKTGAQNILALSEKVQKAFAQHPTANSFEEMLPSDITQIHKDALGCKLSHERECKQKNQGRKRKADEVFDISS